MFFSPNQDLARRLQNHFLKSQKHCTAYFPSTLTAVFRGCVRELVNLLANTIAVTALWSSTISYLAMV